jgi:ADP-heptose:LPS heptosyltransferase
MTVLLADIGFALRELAMRFARGMAWRLLSLVRHPSTARGKPKSILLVEMTRMGDVVFAVRLASDLRRFLPGTRIGLATKPAYAPLVRLLAKGVEPVPMVAGARQYLRAFVTGRKGRWELGVAVSPALRNLVAIVSAGCRSTDGYLRPPCRWWGYRPRAELASGAFAVPSEHLASRSRRVLLSLCSRFGRRPIRQVTAKTRRGPVRRVVMHAGGVWRFRRWPAERWTTLAQLLRAKGFQVTLVLGPENRGEIARFARLERVGVAVRNAPSFPELVRILRSSDLFIGPDSGVMHLAESLGVRVLALLGPSLATQSGPTGRGSSEIQGKAPCVPCSQCLCVRPFSTCMDRIGAGEVAKEALRLSKPGRRGR